MAAVPAGLASALQDRYTLERELGRGGMATVYLATDLRHQREVALKVLKPALAAALGPERFLQEVRITARLNHPHILPLLDSGDASGALYYAMPYVEGESLRRRLEREKQLPLKEALQIAREAADALDYAHQHGVVHRDVKPENILFQAGHALVADFGIALAVAAVGGDDLTETGLAVGTPPYMSPEQASATGEVDGRSDLYSLGCVVYEMLAGHPPFTGVTAQEILARHSLDAVPLLGPARPALPPGIERVVATALAKMPADRYRTAGQFIDALQAAVRILRTDIEIDPGPDVQDAISSGDFGPAPDLNGGSHGSGSAAIRALAEVGAIPSEVRPEHVLTTPLRPWRERVVLLAALAVLAIVGAMAVQAHYAEDRNAGRIIIAPTVGHGLDTTIAELVTSHLHAAMAEWPTLRPAASERFPARLALTSRATPVAGGIELHASLTDASDGTSLAAASVISAPENLRASAEHLLVDLFARAYQVPEDRISALDSFGPAAVRLFVEAAGSGTAERARLLHEALARDSGFAPAAVALLETSPDHYSQLRGDEWEPIAEAAWVHRNHLSPADRAFVEAKVGWRFIPRYSAAQHVAAWERAVEIAPDRLTHWRGLTLACYRWCSELDPHWWGRSLRLHDSLLQRGDQSLLEEALEVAFLAGDTARMRRYAALLPDEARYGHWLAATGLGRARESAELRRLMERGEFLDMRVGNMAVLTGVDLEGAEAVARQDVNSGNPYQLKAQVVARERGRHAEYRMLRDKMFQLGQTTNRYDVFLANLTIWEWAYFDEPEADSVLDRQDRLLTAIIASGPGRGPDTLATAHCALAQLRLRRGGLDGVAEAVDYLSHAAEAREQAVSRMCAPFLELLAARGGDRDGIIRATRRLNDVVRDRPLDLATGGGMINVEIMLAGTINLELARTYRALGYPEVGLEAVARRPYHADLWGLFGFHNEFLLEEARLLADAGVKGAALDRYDRYFRLRPDPPDLPAWRRTWEQARHERLALILTDDG